eukprot:11224903-Lingulodinium_polyedra.AAC.1
MHGHCHHCTRAPGRSPDSAAAARSAGRLPPLVGWRRLGRLAPPRRGMRLPQGRTQRRRQCR